MVSRLKSRKEIASKLKDDTLDMSYCDLDEVPVRQIVSNFSPVCIFSFSFTPIPFVHSNRIPGYIYTAYNSCNAKVSICKYVIDVIRLLLFIHMALPFRLVEMSHIFYNHDYCK